MSSKDVAISVRDLAKSYTITHQEQELATSRQSLPGRARRLLQRAEKETFWALREVCFDIHQGEVVGIIGRNGAGKSTLLKILSRITEPSAGVIDIYGRVGSLLEVGTGFHPELTGRENVYLNGAILGMRRKEIERQFDAIVDFAGIEKFLDTPVKRYSSGMYVRLAFAVAAHLEPEILIVDEVLAVGDAAFQKKCLGKMGAVAQQGRTVLFVSHNRDAVRQLCSRGILFDGGRIIGDGPAEQVLHDYGNLLRRPQQLTEIGLGNRLDRTSGAVRFTRITAHDPDGTENWHFRMGDTIQLTLSYQAYQDVPSLGLYIAVQSGVTNEVVTSVKQVVSAQKMVAGESATIIIELPDIYIRPGDYSLYIALGDKDCEAFFDVVDENVDLPILSISSDEKDPHRTAGYFSMPCRVICQ